MITSCGPVCARARSVLVISCRHAVVMVDGALLSVGDSMHGLFRKVTEDSLANRSDSHLSDLDHVLRYLFEHSTRTSTLSFTRCFGDACLSEAAWFGERKGSQERFTAGSVGHRGYEIVADGHHVEVNRLSSASVQFFIFKFLTN